MSEAEINVLTNKLEGININFEVEYPKDLFEQCDLIITSYLKNTGKSFETLKPAEMIELVGLVKKYLKNAQLTSPGLRSRRYIGKVNLVYRVLVGRKIDGTECAVATVEIINVLFKEVSEEEIKEAEVHQEQ